MLRKWLHKQRCKAVRRSSNLYQWMAKKMVKLGLFDTCFSQVLLDTMDWPVNQLCNCKKCDVLQRRDW